MNTRQLTLHNTSSRQVEIFTPINKDVVSLYTCGPTVYHYAHIGNLRTYIFEDVLRRVLNFNGYAVKHVMNVTDVGHLTSDADQGEDKLEKGAKRQGKTVWEVAKYYEQAFFADLGRLNILPPDIIARATDEIEEQQQLIATLIRKGYAYVTPKAVYFDVIKFPSYGQFAGQKLAEKEVAVREAVNEDSDKHHPADFALWLFTVGDHASHSMRWPSPWGEGFPGWHIECSAISMKYLGEEFDIHTGGVDHIGTHHPNEIAQSEAATGHSFVHYWIHGEHLQIAGGKMAKSEDNFLRLQSLLDQGYQPLDYRFLCLNVHYRTKFEFSWDELTAAKTSLRNLKKLVGQWGSDVGEVSPKYVQEFHQCVNDDLNLPMAMSVVWNLVNAPESPATKRTTINLFDQVLGLGLANYQQPALTVHERELVSDREVARSAKDWLTADKIRTQLAQGGVEVEDAASGTTWTKIEQ